MNFNNSTLFELYFSPQLKLFCYYMNFIYLIFITIIFISLIGNALPSDIDHFLKHGANQVVIKPLNVDTLKAALSTLH